MNTVTALESAQGYKDFDELVYQVRINDPALMDRVMEPDGYFQTRRTTLAETQRVITDLNAPELRDRTPEDLPTIVFAWGKCRVGSTALTNLFGIAGIPAYYNPIKTAVRHFVLEGEGEPWRVPQRSENPLIFAKNMSGPYHLIDCLVNSLQILVEAGYPPSRIELVMLDRDPYRALDSWINIWGHLIPVERLVQHYIISALNSLRIAEYASQVGIRTSHYVYEASRIPDNAVHRLFRRLGLLQLFNGNVVENWNEKGALASLDSKIIFPKLPGPLQDIRGMHASAPRYLYRERSADRIAPEYRALIEKSGVVECYLRTGFACAEELNLNMFDRTAVFTDTPVGARPGAVLDRRQRSAANRAGPEAVQHVNPPVTRQ